MISVIRIAAPNTSYTTAWLLSLVLISYFASTGFINQKINK